MSEKNQVGSIVEGKVVKIKPFGVIVLLPGNVQGLVHISHISSSFIQNINEYLCVGDLVQVKILSINEENGKIALSMKEAAEQIKKNDEPSYVQAYDSGQKAAPSSSFEDKFKEWLKASNERQAGLNKRNKRR